MCCKSQRLPPSDCQVRGGTTRCCNQSESHTRQRLQRQRQRNRETGRRKKVGEERGRGKKFTGIRGNSSEKYSLTCTVKLMLVVVTDNRVVSSNCWVIHTMYALQTIDYQCLACRYGHRYYIVTYSTSVTVLQLLWCHNEHRCGFHQFSCNVGVYNVQPPQWLPLQAPQLQMHCVLAGL